MKVVIILTAINIFKLIAIFKSGTVIVYLAWLYEDLILQILISFLLPTLIFDKHAKMGQQHHSEKITPQGVN